MLLYIWGSPLIFLQRLRYVLLTLAELLVMVIVFMLILHYVELTDILHLPVVSTVMRVWWSSNYCQLSFAVPSIALHFRAYITKTMRQNCRVCLWHLSTWQMTAASYLTALGALWGRLTFSLAWYHEHTAAIATELLQPLVVVCGTLYRSNCTIQTSPADCLGDS